MDLIKGNDFRDIDFLVAQNLSRLTRSFREMNVDNSTFSQNTEQVLDDVTADIMGTEAAISRVQLLSGREALAAYLWPVLLPHRLSLRPGLVLAGTHAITVGLLSCLRPKGELLCVTGDPYDTLEEVLGVRGEPGVGNLTALNVASRCHYGLFTAEGGVHVSTIADSIKVGMSLLGAQCHAYLHAIQCI